MPRSLWNRANIIIVGNLIECRSTMAQDFNIQREVLQVLDTVLSLNGRVGGFTAQTALLGALPELDSMAVATVLASLEERFDFIVEDDEIDGSVFENVGSLTKFVESKLSA